MFVDVLLFSFACIYNITFTPKWNKRLYDGIILEIAKFGIVFCLFCFVLHVCLMFCYHIVFGVQGFEGLRIFFTGNTVTNKMKYSFAMRGVKNKPTYTTIKVNIVCFDTQEQA